MAIDKEVQDKIDAVDKKVEETKNEVKDIQLQLQKYQEKVDSLVEDQKEIKEDQKEFKREVKEDMNDLKHITLTSSNSMMTMMSQLMINKENNQTQKDISIGNNRTKIIVQVLISAVALATVFFAGTQM